MNWQIVTAGCAATSLLFGALNAWQNVRIELKIALLRNDLLSNEIGPLKERVATLEAQLQPLRVIHGAKA